MLDLIAEARALLRAPRVKLFPRPLEAMIAMAEFSAS
jgi:hypothetical protein